MENEAINQAVDKAVLEAVTGQLVIQSGVTSAIVIAGFVFLRFALVHFIRRKTEILDKEQRQWINRINNGATVAIVLSLVLIWAPQLQTFALSLTAVAVAVVLTTKELLMCLTGGFLRASSKQFGVGDWICVDGVAGEVMSINAMTTVLQRIDTHNESYEFTGETVQLPNSRFLTANVENYNFIKNYSYHNVSLTVQWPDGDPPALMQELKRIVQTHYAPYQDDARQFNRNIEKKTAVDFPDPDPQFFLTSSDLGHYVFTVRLFTPTRNALAIASQITQDFLDFAHRQRAKVAPANRSE